MVPWWGKRGGEGCRMTPIPGMLLYYTTIGTNRRKNGTLQIVKEEMNTMTKQSNGAILRRKWEQFSTIAPGSNCVEWCRATKSTMTLETWYSPVFGSRRDHSFLSTSASSDWCRSLVSCDQLPLQGWNTSTFLFTLSSQIASPSSSKLRAGSSPWRLPIYSPFWQTDIFWCGCKPKTWPVS